MRLPSGLISKSFSDHNGFGSGIVSLLTVAVSSLHLHTLGERILLGPVTSKRMRQVLLEKLRAKTRNANHRYVTSNGIIHIHLLFSVVTAHFILPTTEKLGSTLVQRCRKTFHLICHYPPQMMQELPTATTWPHFFFLPLSALADGSRLNRSHDFHIKYSKFHD